MESAFVVEKLQNDADLLTQFTDVLVTAQESYLKRAQRREEPFSLLESELNARRKELLVIQSRLRSYHAPAARDCNQALTAAIQRQEHRVAQAEGYLHRLLKRCYSLHTARSAAICAAAA